MRWRWPPENSCGYLPNALPSRPTLSSSARARCSRSAGVRADAVDRHRLDQRLADREARVQADAYGFWNTIWMRRRIAWRSRSRQLQQVAAVEDHLAVASARAGAAASGPSSSCPSPTRRPRRACGRGAARSSTPCTALNSRWPKRPVAMQNALGQRAHLEHHRRVRVLRRRARRARGARRRCGRRSPSAAPGGHAGSAGRPAAPWCRRPAARSKMRATGPCSRTMPWRITTTWSAISPTSAEVVADEQHAHAVAAPSAWRAARGSGAGSSRRARWSARRRSAAWARRPAPSRSSRAAAGRPTARADRRQAPLRLGDADLGQQRLGALAAPRGATAAGAASAARRAARRP